AVLAVAVVTWGSVLVLTTPTTHRAAGPPPPSGVSAGRCPAYPAFPGAGCTGVPAGTVLAAYAGPCTITTDNTVIKDQTVNCDLQIRASGVLIEESRVNGLVLLDTDDPR